MKNNRAVAIFEDVFFIFTSIILVVSPWFSPWQPLSKATSSKVVVPEPTAPVATKTVVPELEEPVQVRSDFGGKDSVETWKTHKKPWQNRHQFGVKTGQKRGDKTWKIMNWEKEGIE